MFRKKRKARSIVDGARVGCPIRGIDVDIEECTVCHHLLRFVDGPPPYVSCNALRIDPATSRLDC